MTRGANEKTESVLPIKRPSLSEGVFRTWTHEPFLERMGDERFRDRSAYTLGAFLVLRLVDRYAVQVGGIHPDALAYQEEATLDYVLKLNQEDAEARHLMELLRVSKAVREGGGRSLLWAPLLAYAYWLEQELRLKEALDVVDTALRMDDGTAPEKEVAALLQEGRIYRLLGNFDAARRYYRHARTRAERLGDTHSVLLSRIGEAIVLRQVGNLPGSEKALREILRDAERLGDRDAQARAHHDLGATLLHTGREVMAAHHVYRAFELYGDEPNALRALSDLGEVLKRLGRLDAAENAFRLVLRGSAEGETRACAMIAMLELTSLRRDRLAFGRLARYMSSIQEQLPPYRRIDFHLQLGLGHHRFGNKARADKALRLAGSLAQLYGMNEYVFRAEQSLKKIQSPDEHLTVRSSGPDSRIDDIAGRLKERLTA